MKNFEIGTILVLKGITDYGKSVITRLGKHWTIVGLQSKDVGKGAVMLMILLESSNQRDIRWIELRDRNFKIVGMIK